MTHPLIKTLSTPVFHPVNWEEESVLLHQGHHCLELLRQDGMLRHPPAPQERFLRRYKQALGMAVPLTAFTPIACWFLYQIGWMHGSNRLVGAGTFCALGWSFLAAGAADRQPGTVESTALDIDPEATELAQRNLARLTLPGHHETNTAEAVACLQDGTAPLDLLFLDLDDPEHGKAGYREAFLAAAPRLSRGACIVAHDGCCPRFAQDIDMLEEAIRTTPGWSLPLRLPVDHAGLLLAFKVTE